MTPAALCLLMQTLVAPPQIRGGGIWQVSGAPEFPAISPASCAERSIPAPGVAPGMPVSPGWPHNLPAPLHGIMYAGADVIVIRLCNVSQSPVLMPSPRPVFNAQVVSR